MKKVIAIFVTMIFVASLSIAVLGCSKKEEAAAPAATDAPAVPAAPAAPAAK